MSSEYKNKRKTHTNKYITEAFWQLYAQKAIAQITVRELTQRAGVNRSTFYSHYLDMYDLLAKAEDALLEELGQLLDYQNQEQDPDSPLETIIDYYRRNIDKLSMLLGPTGDPAFASKVMERFIPVIMDHLGIDLNNEEAYCLLSFLVSGVLTYLAGWYHREKLFPPLENIHSVRRALIGGFESALSEHSADTERLFRFIHFDV
ncbi:TetR family transcriptional regulator [Anaerotignum sp.]